MAALNAHQLVDAGTKPTFVAATASDTVPVGNDHDVIVIYKNTDANIKTITIEAPGNTAYGQPMPNPILSLPATTGELWIPMRQAYDEGVGRTTLTVTGTGGVTGVTIAVVRTA